MISSRTVLIFTASEALPSFGRVQTLSTNSFFLYLLMVRSVALLREGSDLYSAAALYADILSEALPSFGRVQTYFAFECFEFLDTSEALPSFGRVQANAFFNFMENIWMSEALPSFRWVQTTQRY